jgi:hypothetical protein
MSQAAAIQAVRQRFITQVATPNSLVVVYDNGPVPATTTPRAVVTVSIDGEQQLTMGGARKFRATGTLEVALYVPRERGDAALLTLAQAVIAAFQGVTITSPLVRFTPPPSLVGAVDYDAAMARRTVRVPFLSDFTA